MRLGKIIPYLFGISWIFPSKSWANLLDWTYGSFSQVMEQFFGLSKPISPMYTFWPVSIETELDDQPLAWKCCIQMVQNCSMGPMFGVFVGWFCYPGMQETPFVLHSKGNQNVGFIPGCSWFCIFLIFHEIFFQTFLKISQSLLVFRRKLLWKHVL